MIDLCNVVHLTIWLLCAESDGGIRFYDATNGVPADPVDGAAKRVKKKVLLRDVVVFASCQKESQKYY